MNKLKIMLNMILEFPRRLFSAISIFALIRDSEISWKANVPAGARVYESKMGDYSFCGRGTLVIRTNIGRFCSIADACHIGLPMHRMDMVSTSPVFISGCNEFARCGATFGKVAPQPMPYTYIGNDVWIGTGAKIKAGVKIGNGAVIGAGSVVTKDIEPYAIVAGCPAKPIRKRFDERTVDALERSRWWDMNDHELALMAEKFENVKAFLSC